MKRFNIHYGWYIVAGVVAFLLMSVLIGIISETFQRDRLCFDAGGKIDNGVCRPVDGTIKFNDGRK